MLSFNILNDYYIPNKKAALTYNFYTINSVIEEIIIKRDSENALETTFKNTQTQIESGQKVLPE